MPRFTGPGLRSPESDGARALDAKRRRAFELLRAYQVERNASLKNADALTADIARWQGILNRPVVTWASASQWPESHADAIIAHYGNNGPRFVW